MARDWVFASFVAIVLAAGSTKGASLLEDMRVAPSDFPSLNAEKLIRELNLSPKELDVVSGRNGVGIGGDGKRIMERNFVFPDLVGVDSRVSVEDLGHHAGYYKLKDSHDARVFYFFFESRSHKDDPVDRRTRMQQ
ncbi:hypothetical protein MLD38_002559 [Melastoma candidum]|uniref:Uncharacterized protein n=1 Tax=Melastoma candidum TaxID=119954 RepID=A0ACB9S0B6_9MYRT|nr:hypothetical protein MLD38_002559 [Melastoma candidum]